MTTVMANLTYIDLFAGCGGFSSGLEMAGLRGLLHLEKDEWACDTLAANFSPDTVLCADIRKVNEDFIDHFHGVDVIVGGPPCQGFSVAGSSQFGVYDPRNELILWYLKWVERLRPKVAIIENVPGILTKRDKFGKTVPDVVKERLAPLGYNVYHRILTAAEFGVPQLRSRAFIFCVSDGYDLSPPQSTHHAEHVNEVLDLFSDPKRSFITVGEALSDLPEINAGEGSDDLIPYLCPPRNAYQKLMRLSSGGVANHVAMKHTKRLIERFATIKEGESLKDVAMEYGQLKKFSSEVNEKPFKYNNYRLPWHKPSLTIPASFQSLFLHPRLDRNLTAREAARLMSFPDHFVFKGKRTTMSWEKNLSQYNQIGNAVCPLVARAVGQSLAESIMTSLESGPEDATLKNKKAPKFNSELFRKSHVLPTGQITKDLLQIIKDCFSRMFGGTRAELNEDWILRNSLQIPTVALPLAVLIITQQNCPLCDEALAPFGHHAGSMPFLISKDDLITLLANENDHGLDYHLRVLLGIDYQIGHMVGELLAEYGLGELANVENKRTGRNVRGIIGVSCPYELERLRPLIFGGARDANAA